MRSIQLKGVDDVSEPSPDLFLDAALGYQKTASIKAAIALDLFTALAEEDGNAERVASRTKASSRGVRILCDYLTVHGFLTKDGTRYRLTPSTSIFLTTTSPAWMGSVVDFLASPEMMNLWGEDPAGFVHNGGSVGLGSVAPDHPMWVKFAKAMVPFMAPVVHGVLAEVTKWPTAPKRILDVAAGHGMFGISLAQALPQAQVTAIDWPQVLEVARENAQRAGVADRYEIVPGNAFEVGWGAGRDLVLLANFSPPFRP